MFRSGYFNCPRKLFPRIVDVPEKQKWLEGGKYAPTQSDVWGDKKPSFKNLLKILDFHASSSKKKKVTNKKGKQKNEPTSNFEKEVVKGKAKAKAGESSKKKAGPSNSSQNND
jgi:hypothetical protein